MTRDTLSDEREMEGDRVRKRRKLAPSDEIKKQHSTTIISPKQPIHSQIFTGSRNYAEFYNRQVSDFFKVGEPTHLGKSVLNVEGDVIYMERGNKKRAAIKKEPDDDELSNVDAGADDQEDDESDEPTSEFGVIWTPIDKGKFFNALARHSIHRLDVICEQLPNKSQLDILNYYQLLKNELQGLKTRSRKFKRLLRMSDMPTSYEMSEDFVRMEESQANAMIAKENYNARRNKKLYVSQMQSYMQSEEYLQERDPRLRQQALLDISSENDVTKIPPNLDSLLNVENMADLRDSLYMKAPFHESSQPPSVAYASIDHLESLIKEITTGILLKAIQVKLAHYWIGDVRPDSGVYLDAADISRGIESYQMDSKVKSLREYWAGMKDRLDLIVRNDRDIAMKPSMYRGVFIRGKYKRKGDEAESDNCEDDDGLADDELDLFSSQSTPLHISQLQMTQTTLLLPEYEGHEYGFIEDGEDLSENPYAVELFELETEELEKLDESKSKNYEHALLTFLSTFKQPLLNSDEWCETYLEEVENEKIRDAKEKIRAAKAKERAIRRKKDQEQEQEEQEEQEKEQHASEDSQDETPVLRITPKMFLNHLLDFATYR